jgi:hypothetical protein
MSLSNVNFTPKDKNVLTGEPAQQEQGGKIDASVYTLNVCKNGQPDTLKVYGPKNQ